MAQAYKITLTAQQSEELCWVRDHHEKSFMRVKAAAILKVASGQAIRQVALFGLLKPIRPETVSDWLTRYQQEGLDGLLVRTGRGRKPAFSPSKLTQEQAAYQVSEVLHRAPTLFGVDRSCWSLASIRAVIPWMHKLSLSAISQLLRRFALVYKRGRQHVHSPDPLYEQKLAQIARARELAQQAAGHVVFLYADEHTVNLRPQVGRSYQQQGTKGAKATGTVSHQVRLAGVLDGETGQVLTRRRGSFNVKEMARFFFSVECHYPHADVIYIALDNWPNHFHRSVLEYLTKRHSKIRLLRLPTYAPWTNPIEKFWLKLNREFMRQHSYGGTLQAFHDALDLWLDKHREESAALLHEVGLLPDEEVAYRD